MASSSAEGCGRDKEASISEGVTGSEGREYAEVRVGRLEDEDRDSVAGRFELLEDEVELDLRCALHAVRRDLAAFSSEMAAVRVGREDEAMDDILEKLERISWA